MRRSRINVLKRHLDIQRITRQNYVEGLTTYAGVWRNYIEPIYHITYSQYMRILGLGGLAGELEREQERVGACVEPASSNQLNLIDLIDHEKDND